MFQQTQIQPDIGAMSSEALFSIMTGKGKRDQGLEEKLQHLFARENQGLLNLLSVNRQELMRVFDFDQDSATALAAFVELSARLTQTARFRGMTMSDPGSVAAYYMEFLRHQTKEIVIAAFFDMKCRFIADEVHSIGCHNASIVSAREIFQAALKADAAQVILLHNHPSGDPSPSSQDREVTRQILFAGKIMGIPLADHIIVGDHCYYSFKEKRLLE